jgi:hypothetical protein
MIITNKWVLVISQDNSVVLSEFIEDANIETLHTVKLFDSEQGMIDYAELNNLQLPEKEST